MLSFVQPYTRRLAASPLGMRFLTGVGWSLAGGVAARGLSLCASIVIARMLHREGFGALGMLQNTAGMFGAFAGAGLGVTITKYAAELHQSDPERTGRIIGLARLLSLITGAVIAIVLFILSPWLASRMLAAPQLGPLLRLSMGLIVLGAINEMQVGAISAFEGFRAMARVNLLSALCSFLFLVFGVWAWGLPGAVGALLAALLVTTGLNYHTLHRLAERAGVVLRYRGCWCELRGIWRFSLLSVISSTMVTPVGWMCNALLVRLPNGYAEMGLLNAANQWLAAIYFLPNTVFTVMLPILANLSGQGKHRAFYRLLRYGLLINGGVSLALAVGLALCSRYILLGYGKDFLAGRTVFLLVIFSSVIIAVTHTFSRAITSQGAVATNLAFTGIWSVSYLILSLLLVRPYRAQGLAMAGLLAVSLEGVCQWSYLAWRQRERPT